MIILLFNCISVGRNEELIKLLRITMPESLDYNEVFDDILERYTVKSKLVRVRTTNLGSMFEISYEITMKDTNDIKPMIDEIRTRNGNLNISLQRVDFDLNRL
ncbi:MAG: hypothetical protein HUJ63_01795 [Enterococcus sp.]|nr:hypothetical protein [Enterococcus sp.]